MKRPQVVAACVLAVVAGLSPLTAAAAAAPPRLLVGHATYGYDALPAWNTDILVEVAGVVENAQLVAVKVQELRSNAWHSAACRTPSAVTYGPRITVTVALSGCSASDKLNSTGLAPARAVATWTRTELGTTIVLEEVEQYFRVTGNSGETGDVCSWETRGVPEALSVGLGCSEQPAYVRTVSGFPLHVQPVTFASPQPVTVSGTPNVSATFPSPQPVTCTSGCVAGEANGVQDVNLVAAAGDEGGPTAGLVALGLLVFFAGARTVSAWGRR